MRMTFTYTFTVRGRSQKYWLSEGTDGHVWEKSRGRCDWNLFGGAVFSFFFLVQKCFFEVQNVSRCTDTHWCNAVGASASKWGRCLSLSTSIQYQWYCNKCTRNPTSVMINYPCVPSYIRTFHNVPPFNMFSHIVCMNKANIYSIYLNIKNKCMHYVKFPLKLDEHTSVSSCCCLLLFLHCAGNIYLQLTIEEPIYPNISATLLL